MLPMTWRDCLEWLPSEGSLQTCWRGMELKGVLTRMTMLGRTGIWGRFDGETLDGCEKETLEWHDSELRRRGELECPEREEEGSRKKSESSLILDYLTIQCYAFSVKIDVFST